LISSPKAPPANKKTKIMVDRKLIEFFNILGATFISFVNLIALIDDLKA
jgi:hypothetical protein